MIKREKYLNELINSMNDKMPKVITGIRRCGKSFLLKEIFFDYLVNERKVSTENIVIIELDDINNIQYRNPIKLSNYIKEKIKNEHTYYVFIDEIQLVTSIINPEFTNGETVIAKGDDKNIISFVNVVLGISRIKNIDLYVTGSNSKLLSKDVVTEFRDKARNIHLQPLSFEEFYSYYGGDQYAAFYEYLVHGGMPRAVLEQDLARKENYLKNLFNTTYLKDIIEHNKFRKVETLDELCNALSFATGQFLNTQKLANIIESRKKEKIDKSTIDNYLNAFMDAYIVEEVNRYDIKGNSVIGALRKYYFSDTGLRNARLNFTSLDLGQLIETVVYNELIYHGYNVMVGSFNQFEKNKNNESVVKKYEVDFYATKGIESIYIQVAENIDDAKTKQRELRPFHLIRDANKKIVLVNRPIKAMKLENGIILDGIVDFIMNLK